MKLLILCVDRDDDLGVKAGINTPVIGREDCLKAAMALGIKDPEESDTNSIFSGISIYDEYIKNGVDVEVAVICGDKDVGIKSDTALANQMETVMTRVDPKSAILVSDGAEDEFIYPILASRIQIDGIKRVIVKQSRNIESIYYMFARSMQDERVRRKFVLPLALALIVFSTFFIIISIANSIYPNAQIPDISWAMVFLTIGIYIVIKAYGLDEPLKAMSTDAKTAISTIPFVMLAGITIIAGILAGWNAVQNESDQVAQILTLFGILLWTGVFAIILLGLGRAMQVYSKENDFPWVFFPMVFSILAFSSFMQMIIIIVSFWMGITDTGIVDDIAAFFGLGVVFLLLGYFSFSGIKEQKRNADWHQ
jgi:putative membrane protein